MALTIAQADLRYLTKDEYILDRRKQDDLLRAEFLNQRRLIEDGFERFGAALADVKDDLAHVKDDLAGVKDDLAGVKDDVRNLKVDLAGVKDDLAGVKDDVRNLKVDMGEVKARLDRFDKRKMNTTAYLPWHRLTPIGVYVPGIGFRTPDYFPKNASSFLKLRSPKRSKDIERLIYLTKFYDVHGFQYWGKDNIEDFQSDDSDSDSNSDSDDAARQDQLLRNAVRAYPLMAWEEVASRIGVKEQNFNRFYERATELALRPQPPVTKRQPEQVEARDTGEMKRPRKFELEDLALGNSGSHPSTSEPEQFDQVRWATPSTAVRARRTLERKIRDNQGLPRSLSEHPSDSPTEPLGSGKGSPSRKEPKPTKVH